MTFRRGDRITYKNSNGTTSTGTIRALVRAPGNAGRQGKLVWGIEWDDIGLGIVPDESKIVSVERVGDGTSLAKDSTVA